jgi:hypothetical protein
LARQAPAPSVQRNAKGIKCPKDQGEFRAWMAALDIDYPLPADANLFGQCGLVKFKIFAAVTEDSAKIYRGSDEHSAPKMSSLEHIITCQRSLTIKMSPFVYFFKC